MPKHTLLKTQDFKVCSTIFQYYILHVIWAFSKHKMTSINPLSELQNPILVSVFSTESSFNKRKKRTDMRLNPPYKKLPS